MKKWMLAIGLLVGLSVAGIYLFIPSRIRIVREAAIGCNANGAYRLLADSGRWVKILGSGRGYGVTGVGGHFISVRIDGSDRVVAGKLLLFSRGRDSTDIRWECDIAGGGDPFSRIRRYRQAVALSERMERVLASFQTYMSKGVNVYGIAIRDGETSDSLVIAMKDVPGAAPTTGYIYALIKKLQVYAGSCGARQTGLPMLNITMLGDGRRQVMVGIPIDRAIRETDQIRARNLVKGRFLVADVVGGPASVELAVRGMENYISDHEETVMAMGFQSLVTDRMAERDSSCWKTRLYYPVY